jgi:hypothetical protein
MSMVYSTLDQNSKKQRQKHNHKHEGVHFTKEESIMVLQITFIKKEV